MVDFKFIPIFLSNKGNTWGRRCHFFFTALVSGTCFIGTTIFR